MQLTEAAGQMSAISITVRFSMGNQLSWHALFKRLKAMLESVDRFNYPRLAASYRYGYGTLRKQQFMVSRMKTPINRIYRKLFAGQLSPVEIPKD